jgi:hypothetical protein
MLAWAGHHPWRFSAACAIALFAVSSVLPIWSAWYFNAWEGLAVHSTFWTMLASLPNAASQVSIEKLLTDFYGAQVVMLVVFLAVGAAVGRAVAWWGGRAA